MTQTLKIKLGEREVELQARPSMFYTYGCKGGDLAKLRHPTQGFAELCLLTWCLLDNDAHRRWSTPADLAPFIAVADKDTLAAIGNAITRTLEAIHV